jgi:hypothetical protein
MQIYLLLVNIFVHFYLYFHTWKKTETSDDKISNDFLKLN